MTGSRWLSVEVRHLAALRAVAATGSFTRAGRLLGYSQSAVSQQIAGLEAILGERLVERSPGPRSVSFTKAGNIVLQRAAAVVAALEAADEDLAAA